MESKARSWTATACALVIALLTVGGAAAQESAGETEASETGSESSGKTILLEAWAWVAQAYGIDYTPATQVDSLVSSQSNLLRFPTGTEARGRYRVAYTFPGRIGEFAITYYSHEEKPALAAGRPGEFLLGETLVHPLHAGVFDDGLADWVESDTVTRLRDFRIDYYRPAFRNEQASAKWFVGWRRVFHSREIGATYYALAPDLPPVLPPISTLRPDLDPVPDTAFQKSQFEGRGPEAGMDFLVPLWEDRIELEAGFALAVLRGVFETYYTSQTSAYALDLGGGDFVALAPPYDEFNDSSLINDIRQLALPIGLASGRVSGDATAVDAYIGVRWRAWKSLEVLAGFRASRYDDVALELRPKQVTYSINGVLNVEDVERSLDSAGYEGFYGGLAYRF